jgi:hypothetical protein
VAFVFGLIPALAGGRAVYQIGRKLVDGTGTRNWVTFRRHYPDGTEKVFTIDLR